MKKAYKIISISFFVSWMTFFSSCKKFVEIAPPRTDLIKATVFDNDATAEAALRDIYFQISSAGRFGFASGSFASISHFAPISSDEQLNYYTGDPSLTTEIKQFADNALTSNNSYLLQLWSSLYSSIYKTNSVIEGLALPSSNVSLNKKKQLEGESKFIRAFCYFYLVNLWGDVPLITTTDYRTNNTIPGLLRKMSIST
ncbi:MAG: RagB/SusD family nutrient uptake outer membrane protein [Bacteroidota bacterium]